MEILIVEDELIISEMMADMLIDLGYNVVGQARNYNEATNFLNQKPVDIALLDINLGDGKDGVDLAKFINSEIHIPFIFISSNADVATVKRAKSESPFGYLQKPFDEQDLYSSIEVALINFSRSNLPSGDPLTTEIRLKDSIFIKDGRQYIKVKLDDLIYIKSDGNYLELQTLSKMYLVRSTLKDFSKKLPLDIFGSCHRSYLINLTKIEEIGSNFVVVQGKKVPIVKEHRDMLISRIE